MDERKIIIIILLMLVYGLYNIRTWFGPEEMDIDTEVKGILKDPESEDKILDIITNGTQIKKDKIIYVNKIIFPKMKNACSILDVFIEKPPKKCKDAEQQDERNIDRSKITVIGITVFLVVLAINAVLDVLKVKEEERARLRQNPEGVRRQSLAEFANRKPLKREPSKIGQQLLQIAEAIAPVSEKKPKKVKPYVRGESTNSYLSERQKPSDSCTHFKKADSEGMLVKRQSVTKLYGGTSASVLRRCSFPVLPANPDLQSLMMDGCRRPSTDSDEEYECKKRRIRLIRRY